jgi:hypothetical protein
LIEETATIFVGAGVSMGAGYAGTICPLIFEEIIRSIPGSIDWRCNVDFLTPEHSIIEFDGIYG